MPMEVLLAVISFITVSVTICRSSSLESLQYSLGNADEMKPKNRESHLRFYQKPPKELSMMSSENGLIECQAGGSPPPLMHWLKDGERIETNENDYLSNDNVESADSTEGSLSESMLGISSTNIRLYLNCVTPENSGVYTCVAETPYNRISTRVHLKVDSSRDHSSRSESGKSCGKKTSYHQPRIGMWSRKRLEFMGENVRLYCRAGGSPKPIIEWLDTKGTVIVESQKYKILPNGDLIIRRLKWSDMGNYICNAKNIAGSDRVETFLYPTRPGK